MATLDYTYFNVVEYIRKLRNAGVKQEVAEIEAEGMNSLMETMIKQTTSIFNTKDLVTKNDLQTEVSKINSEIAKINSKITKVNSEIEKVITNTSTEFAKVNSEIEKTMLKTNAEIAKVRYDTLKFVVWTGATVIISLISVLGGMIAKGFHWI